MAFQRLVSPRILSTICRSTFYQQNNFTITTSTKSSSTIELEDVIDNFTTELLHKKKDAWDMRNEKLKSMKLPLKNKKIELKVQSFTRENLDELLNSALLECNDSTVVAILKESLRVQICPSQEYILQIMNVCAQNGEIDLISDLEKLFKCNGVHLPSNFCYDIYKAEAIWIKGYVIKGLDMYQRIYMKNPFSRRYIRMTFKKLIEMEVKHNSEAVLIHMLKVAKNFITQHKDYFFLVCIWESCFMSELYSDQQLAVGLIYKEKRLAEVISNRLPFLLNTALKNHRTEVIYKLLECFHLLHMKEECTIVAMAFLDYYFVHAHVGNYSEIIRWCQNSDISLPGIYNKKFLNLLLKIESVPVDNKTKNIDQVRNTDFIF